MKIDFKGEEQPLLVIQQLLTSQTFMSNGCAGADLLAVYASLPYNHMKCERTATATASRCFGTV